MATGCVYCTSRHMEVPVVKDFDLDRYLGRWYEIARITHFFEKGLVDVTADYSYAARGIKVLNSGIQSKPGGRLKLAVGKAKVAAPARLRVSFFLWFYSDYNVLDTDYETYALVGGGKSDYLWILSRSKQLDDALYKKLVRKAGELGYQIEKLERVP